MPNVTVLMTGAGGGHLASAQSLAEAFEGKANVTLLNLLDEHAPFPFNRLSASYAPVVAIAPDLYRLAYDVVQTRLGVRFMESGGYGLLHVGMGQAIVTTDPDIVISVHALLNAVPMRSMRAAGCTARFVSAVVDAGIPSISWFAKEADLCCVADEEIRALAIDAGMPPGRVLATGLPIRHAFVEARSLSRFEARARVGVDPESRLVLLVGGGAGMGQIGRLAVALSEVLGSASIRAHVAVVAGSNDRLRRRLQRREMRVPTTVMGFTDHMAEWMAASDILLTKAGPGTIAEAACLGVPTLLTGFVPGQEEHNAAWAQRNGGAVFEPKPRAAAALVGRWLSPGNEELGAMSSKMRAMGRPNAARDIADAALGLLDT